MISYKKLHSIAKHELGENSKNLIIRGKNNVYKVFGRYQIVPFGSAFKVFHFATEIGIFHSTRTALSWCLANKYMKYELASKLLDADNRLQVLKNDIAVRVSIAANSKQEKFHDELVCKIENKVIRKKQLEYALRNYVNLAKYQYRGIYNETE